MTLTASKINKCFVGQTHQGDVLDALYELLYSKCLWALIKRIQGWPKAGLEVHRYVGECFVRFDKAYHSKVVAGGLWMNNGWSADQELSPWEVVLAPYTLVADG